MWQFNDVWNVIWSPFTFGANRVAKEWTRDRYKSGKTNESFHINFSLSDWQYFSYTIDWSGSPALCDIEQPNLAWSENVCKNLFISTNLIVNSMPSIRNPKQSLRPTKLASDSRPRRFSRSKLSRKTYGTFMWVECWTTRDLVNRNYFPTNPRPRNLPQKHMKGKLFSSSLSIVRQTEIPSRDQ